MNDTILGIIVGRSEEDLVSRSNETRSHLFSSFILHFHSKKNLARREPWLVGESSSSMQFHPPYLPYPFYPCSLLCIQVDLYIYHLRTLPSLLPVFIPRVSFPVAEAFIRMLFSYVHTWKMFHGKKGRVHNPGYRREYKADSTIL